MNQLLCEQRAGLLRSILLDPADDAARLIYADHLEEYQERETDAAYAELIQVQVEIWGITAIQVHGPVGVWSEMRPGVTRNRLWKLQDRERRLIGEVFGMPLNGDGTLPFPLPSPPFDRGRIYEYPRAILRRGFFSDVRLTHDKFMRNAERLFRVQPIERVVLTDEIDPTAIVPIKGGMNKDLWSLYLGERTTTVAHPEMQLSNACVRYGRIKAGLEKANDD